MQYRCKWFKLYELLPESEYRKLAGIKNSCVVNINYIVDHNLEHIVAQNKGWMYFNPYLLMTADTIRKTFGPRVVNDWAWRPGDVNANNFRGWRPFDCKEGAILSPHKFGRGLDSVSGKKIGIDGYNTERQYIIEHLDRFPYITRLEANIPWLHYDIHNHNREQYGDILLI